MKLAIRRGLGILVAMALLVGAVLVLRRELGQHPFREVMLDLLSIPPARLAIALFAALISYAALVCHDVLAMRAMGAEMPIRKVVVAGFTAFAFANSLPFAVVSGAAVRSRFYARSQVPAGKITQLVLFNTVTYSVGLLTAVGLALTVAPGSVPRVPGLPFNSNRVLGAIVLLIIGLFLAWSATGKPVIRFGNQSLEPTSLRIALIRLGVSLADWVFSAACLFALLPGTTSAGFPRYIGVFLLGEIAGLISQLPAGIGVFEAVVLRMLRESGRVTATLGALIAYRAIYYLFPLMVAIPIFVISEFRRSGAKKVERRA